MGVNHRRPDVFMAGRLFHRADAATFSLDANDARNASTSNAPHPRRTTFSKETDEPPYPLDIGLSGP